MILLSMTQWFQTPIMLSLSLVCTLHTGSGQKMMAAEVRKEKNDLFTSQVDAHLWPVIP